MYPTGLVSNDAEPRTNRLFPWTQVSKSFNRLQLLKLNLYRIRGKVLFHFHSYITYFNNLPLPSKQPIHKHEQTFRFLEFIPYFQLHYFIKYFPLKPSNVLSIMSLPILHSFPGVIINSDKHGHYLKVLVVRHVKLFFGWFNRSSSMPLRFPPKIHLSFLFNIKTYRNWNF